MTEDGSDVERRGLPRFVRDIGVLGSAGPRQRAGIGVLSTFDGVLDVGVDGSDGIPPALNYLTLPEIVANGLNRHNGKDPSPRTTDATAPSSEPRSPDDETDTKVYHVLRSDERSGEERTSAQGTAGEGPFDRRPSGESDRTRSDSSDGPASTTAPEADARSEPDRSAEPAGSSPPPHDGGREREGAGSLRDIDAIGSTPRALGGDRDEGGRLTSTVARPPAVLATASIPGRTGTTGSSSGRSGESIPTRPVAGDSTRPGVDTRTVVDTERRPGSTDRPETVDHSLGGRDGSDGASSGRTGRDGTAIDERERSETGLGTLNDRSLTVASSRRSDDASSPGGTGGPTGSPVSAPTSPPTDRDASFPDWMDDRRGSETGRGASTTRLTVLHGSTSGDSAGGSKAGGSAGGGGRSGRSARTLDDGTAGPGSPATGSTDAGTGPIGGPVASPVDRQSVTEFPFPRNLSLEGGGPDARFLEEVYRELTKKLRDERRRGWY